MDELLAICAETCEWISEDSLRLSLAKRLQRDPILKKQAETIRRNLHTCAEVYAPASAPETIPSSSLKAVAWNIERGKNLDGILKTFRSHPELSGADLYFLTEVDWGMARSGNQNVTAELGRALGFYAYFSPSYFNLTRGHGAERQTTGENTLGLHGKAILSRSPLKNLRAVSLPNATDKLSSKEARLGEKRALLGDLVSGDKILTVGCAHLDAFSSPKSRARQLVEVAKACPKERPTLIAGDWNTNTLNSTSGITLFLSVLRQLLVTRPRPMIQEHHPYPERYYDRPLFEMLQTHGFDYQDYNEMGVGTFDLISNDEELGQMVRDQFPEWLLKRINRLVEKSGGKISLKLDWFAGKGLRCHERRVIRLKPGEDFEPPHRPSDHHPIWLEFSL